MKRGATEKPKARRLGRRLKLQRWGVVGVLESLWDFARWNAPAGDVGRFEDADLAEAIDWRGDPGKLIAALTEEGWLDATPACRLGIHDWHEHADDGTHRTLARARQFFWNGHAPKLSRLGRDERPEADAWYAAHARIAPDVRTPGAQSAHSETTNAPPPCLALPGQAIEGSASVSPTLPPPASADDLFNAWNQHRGGLPRAHELTAKRRRHATARLRDRPLLAWVDIVKRMAASAFCCGENDRGWRASFDWLISSPDVAVKTLEGKYDSQRVRPAPRRPEPGGAITPGVEATKQRIAALSRAPGEPEPMAAILSRVTA